MKHIVGISEMKVSRNAKDTIITYSLGSCVGISLHDVEAGIGGMVHCLLPLSSADPARALAKPCMFTDSGVSALIKRLIRLGAEKERLVAKVAGGSSIMAANDQFKIGERNYTVMRKILWKNNILIAAEDVGGVLSRTLTLHLEDGRVTVHVEGRERELV